MYRIGKTFSFEASHHLESLPEGHKCARTHGHSYQVEVILESDVVSGPGFVTDFSDLAAVKAHLDSEWDHRDLSEVMRGAQPTSENVARVIFEWSRENLDPRLAALVSAVKVSETRSTWAEYRPDQTGSGQAA
jgi:6-pyruvoyltetrahydropterin/6-carboxytetrahydropterin synthase